MLDLIIFAFVSGFAVSIAPGLVNLLAFEQVLNTSFRAGWAVALGGTTGQGLFVTAVIGMYVIWGDAPFIQTVLSRIEDVIDFATAYNSIAAIVIGLLVLLGGFYYLRKKGREEEHPGAGFLVGMLLTLGSLDYMLTYATIFGVRTDGLISPVTGVFIILATVIGIHTCWFGKIAIVQMFKNVMIRYNWTDFNKITGWFLIVVGVPILLWGLFTI